MKTHKIKHGGEFDVSGIDDTFRTYCGLNSYKNSSENIKMVGRHDECTCKSCDKSYKKEVRKWNKDITHILEWKNENLS